MKNRRPRYTEAEVVTIRTRIVDLLKSHSDGHYHPAHSLGEHADISPSDVPVILNPISYRKERPVAGRQLEVYESSRGKFHYRFAPCSVQA